MIEEPKDQIQQINNIILKYEEILSWKRGGSIDDRVAHVLGQYRQIADNSIFECKRFMEDVKTQFKALEMIVEGLTTDGLNHGQKRTIANHIITMLRSMVDRLDRYEYTYSSTTFDRYNFFRSDSPERRLHESHRELKDKTKYQEKILKTLQEVHPDIFKSLTNSSDDSDDIPF